MSADDAARIQLAFAGLTPGRVTQLVARHGPVAALRRVVAGSEASERASAEAAEPFERRMQTLQEVSASLALRGSDGFPPFSDAIADPPDALFHKGAWPHLPGVAVVGTRTCTRYGRALAREYGHAIAAAGWTLVSGLARGIDGAAHRGTVAAGGHGVAVLGCGVDVDYPREHGELATRLVAGGGAVCSEYPPGTPPEGWRFPPRNRIIVGLSAAVVVVEAARRGGALITAHLAMEAGIPVFAVPGDVGRRAAEGCNLLIRDGAHPVLDAADLIEELSLVLGPPRTTPPEPPQVAGVAIPPGGITVEELAATAPDAAAVLAELTDEEMAGRVSREGDAVYRF